eukprot:8601160-Prorocentrum_lima.AAC.1
MARRQMIVEKALGSKHPWRSCEGPLGPEQADEEKPGEDIARHVCLPTRCTWGRLRGKRIRDGDFLKQ